LKGRTDDLFILSNFIDFLVYIILAVFFLYNTLRTSCKSLLSIDGLDVFTSEEGKMRKDDEKIRNAALYKKVCDVLLVLRLKFSFERKR
jgi:hypothetical protein